MNATKCVLPLLALTLALSGTIPACKDVHSTPPVTSTPDPTVTMAELPNPPVSLKGAGGTFPSLLYQKWFTQFDLLYNVQINYDAVGSGVGISDITAGSVDFGASDGIMTDSQVSAAEAAGGPILHIPMTSGSVAVIYNIPGVPSGTLRLNGPVLADIYLGTITEWNDPAISALNPGLNLPSAIITTVHRSDSSGTTNMFTNYLSKINATWVSTIGGTGFATSIKWPTDALGSGVGAVGSAAVATQVQQTPDSIGYTELAYALQNNLTFAELQNSSGVFIAPSLASTTAAATGINLPDDMKIMLTNSSNKDAYPIAGFTWILVYQNQKDSAKGAELVDFLWWAIHDGVSYETDLTYAPLSTDATKKAEALLESIQYNGQPLLKQGS
jgi:phosphate transport system substrate-binding protein